jgi:hypothetical protein
MEDDPTRPTTIPTHTHHPNTVDKPHPQRPKPDGGKVDRRS